jgi:CheY-like chemotaxis protein
MSATSLSITILVVEDEALIRLHGMDVLEEAGFVVLDAADADEALAVLTQQHGGVALMFSDINMPGTMDGVALANVVCRHWPRVRLLLTSANHQPGLGAMPVASRFMPKPWGNEALVRNIRAMLAG